MILVRKSNLYDNRWDANLDLTREELKTFLGILVIIGFHSLPTLKSYWLNDHNFNFYRVINVFRLKRFF